MHCLLCHEKIPRLRAWTGKSEFCSDEHAELFRKQTMERLLVDDSQDRKPAAALPIAAADPPADPPAVDHILLGSQTAHGAPRAPNGAEDAEEVDELWKLADRAGALNDSRSTESRLTENVVDQSGEDALEALRALAAESSASSADAAAESEEFDDFANLESSLKELLRPESAPTDAASLASVDDVDNAPELQLDALSPGPELVDPVRVEAPQPPEMAADFEGDQLAAMELHEPEASDLIAQTAEDLSELSNPPEPADFQAVAKNDQRAAKAARPAAQKRPQLRPVSELQPLDPAAVLPDGGGYPLKPWTDVLDLVGPDRSSLLGAASEMELRKSCLNGTSSGTFDPVLFKPSERIAMIPLSILPPQGDDFAAERLTAMRPAESMAWPGPLHVAMSAAEMEFQESSEGGAVDESLFALKQASISREFLSRVALDSRILEPQDSVILSPPERDGLTSASEEEDSDLAYASGGDNTDAEETDGGERVHVAELF